MTDIVQNSASAAPAHVAQPKIFARQATGLRKEVGSLDVLVYNTNNQNIGLGVAFLLLALTSYVGGNFPLSAILATVLVIPLYFVYSQLSADLPRSGGDYVWVSRIFGRKLGPVTGFMLSWSWIILAFTSIGVPAVFFTRLGLAPMMRSLGVATGTSGFTSFGNWVSGNWGTFIVGTVLLAVFTWLLIHGVHTYMRVQNIAFFVAIAGVIIGVVIALIVSPHTFAAHFNTYAHKLGSPKADSYATVALAAPHATASSVTSTFYAMTWTLYMVLFGATSCYIGGEIRRPARTQRVGMFGSLVLTGGAITILLLVLEHSMTTRFLTGLAGGASSSLGFSFTPTYNELLSIAAGPTSVIVALVMGLTFLFWTYVWMPINYFTSTRLMLALSIDGYLPAAVSKVHSRHATPWVSILIASFFGELSLILYLLGILSVITLLWGGVIMFVVAGIAAMIYPFTMKDNWSASGGRRLGSVPTISIWGGLLVIAMAIVLWVLWADPAVGIGHSVLQKSLNIGLPLSGLVVFFGIWWVQRMRGVDVRLSATEIPPE